VLLETSVLHESISTLIKEKRENKKTTEPLDSSLVHSVPPHTPEDERRTSPMYSMCSASHLGMKFWMENWRWRTKLLRFKLVTTVKERCLLLCRSAVPVDIYSTQEERTVDLASSVLPWFGYNDAKLKKEEGAAEKEDQVMESRKEDEDEKKSQDSVRERPDSNVTTSSMYPTDGQDIETILLQ
jgi:hypothetical protein